jgi:quinol monooxygenase YgiN
MIIVTAKLPIQPEKREEFLGAVGGLVEASNAEEGVLHYRLFEAVDTPNEFVMLEHYADEAALGAHFETDHLKGALQHLAGWLSGPPELTRYDAGEGTPLPLG